jgi:hypothetical protein
LLLFVLTTVAWAALLGLTGFLAVKSKGIFLNSGRVQSFSAACWRRFGALSLHPRKCMVAIIILAIVLRLLALPILTVPYGRSHDEFSYILAGQTFALGRLTNPTPPLWQFFETEHVLMHPTYMSKYPPVPGLFLALGILFGNIWFGVLISFALMCGLVYWMAQAYLPSRWALMAGVLPLVHPGIASYWCNSYFGGATPAIGGALVLGSCGRLYRKVSALSLSLLVLGLAILANTRPFEGAAVAVAPLMVFAFSVLVKHKPALAEILKKCPLPVLLALLLLAAMLYYNYCLTGNALLLPYIEWQRQYSPIPLSLFSKMGTIPHYNSTILRDNYVTCDYAVYSKFLTWQGLFDAVVNERFIGMQQYFVGITLVPIAFAALWGWKDRKMLVPWLSLLTLIVAISSTAVGFQRHYPSPGTAAIEVLLVQGFRHLRLFKWKMIPVGIPLARVFVAMCAVGILCGFASLPGLQDRIQHMQDEFPRVAIMKKLNAIPGKHLIVVHYAEGHDPRREYVINEPDIDKANIVWARDFGDEKNKELLEHFRDRHIWLFDPDNKPEPRLYTWAESRGADLSKKVDNSNWTH